jgi:hypothetical protein
VVQLRTPPFAAGAVASARAGNAPHNHVCVYVGWPPKHRVAPIYRYASWKACVPPNEDPAAYDWRFCAGMDVFIVGAGEEIAKALAPIGTRNTIILNRSAMTLCP